MLLMGIFEDVVLGAKSAATTVGKKAGELVDISKLRFSASEINSEINKRFEAMGRVIYDSKKDGTNVDGLVTECVRSIDALYERLDDVNASLARLRRKNTCRSCGAINETEAVYCSRCGQRMQQSSEKQEGSEE